MRLSEILQECKRHGVQLAAKPSGLSVRGNLTPELREELRRHKPNLLHYLRTGNCHHDMKPEVCKVCNGHARKLVEEGMSPEWAEAEVLGKDIAS